MTSLTDIKRGIFGRNEGRKIRRLLSSMSLVDTLVRCVSDSTQVVCVQVRETDNIQTHGLLPSYRRAHPPLSNAESFSANLFTAHTAREQHVSSERIRNEAVKH